MTNTANNGTHASFQDTKVASGLSSGSLMVWLPYPSPLAIAFFRQWLR